LIKQRYQMNFFACGVPDGFLLLSSVLFLKKTRERILYCTRENVREISEKCHGNVREFCSSNLLVTLSYSQGVKKR